MTGGTFLAVVGALILIWSGAHDLHHYRAGTPRTATITHCGTQSCEGWWSIGGQTGEIGEIVGSFPKPSVGSTVEIRESNGKGYTANSYRLKFAEAGCLLVGVIVFIVWRRRRKG